MDNGRQLYSRLSQLTRRSFLVHKELTTFLNVVKTDCDLNIVKAGLVTIHQENYKRRISMLYPLRQSLSITYLKISIILFFTIGCTADVVKVMWA